MILRHSRGNAKLTARSRAGTIAEMLHKDAKVELLKHVPLFERWHQRSYSAKSKKKIVIMHSRPN